MLPGQVVVFALLAIPCGFHLATDYLGRRRVFEQPLKPPLPVELDDGNTASGPKLLLEARKVGNPLRQVMVSITGEDEVEFFLR